MQWWDDIRNYFYRRNIAQKLAGIKRKSVLTNLHNALTVGILYDSTDTANDGVIAAFAEGLRQQDKTVEILAFVNDKKVEQKAGILVFNPKSLNWARVPNNEQINTFAAKEFDLLFAAFITENLPLEYIARTSKAKWKVSCYDQKKTDFYDLMINLGNRTDLSYFIEQATYFLNKIQYDSK